MTDFAQEQADELEALESIFPEELQMVSETDPKSFTLAITSEESSVPGPDQHFATVSLKITYTPTYPDELPVFELADLEGLPAEKLAELTARVTEEAEENVGMAVGFVLHTAAKEWLDEECIAAKEATFEAEEFARQEELRLEAERLAAGTLVTPESFNEWAQKFNKEMRGKSGKQEQSKRVTGRMLFEKGGGAGVNLQVEAAAAAVASVQVGGEDAVAVDEGLFEGLGEEDFASAE